RPAVVPRAAARRGAAPPRRPGELLGPVRARVGRGRHGRPPCGGPGRRRRRRRVRDPRAGAPRAHARAPRGVRRPAARHARRDDDRPEAVAVPKGDVLEGIPGVATLWRVGTRPLGSVRAVRTAERTVVLTFDDGPVEGSTEGVLASLAEAGATATFFVLMT